MRRLKEKKERVDPPLQQTEESEAPDGSGQVPPASMGSAGPGAAEVRVDKAGIDRTGG